jgi:3-hydroxyisobutyrate dehydrogenase
MSGKQTVAVVGLGSMGFGIARSLLRAGHIVRGFDIDRATLQRLTEEGGQATESPAAAAARADVVVVVVVNAAQTDTVLNGEGGILPVMRAGAAILASPTMAPVDARRFAEQAAGRGIHYLDAPISGGAVRAEAGQLTVMASGQAAAFAAAGPTLQAIAGTVYNLGEAAGIGSAFKIVNQLLAGVHIAAACEAITFAKSLDLDLAKVFEVITHSAGNSWMFENRIPHVLDGDYSPKSAVSIFTKDLGIVTEIARKQKFPLPIASTALQLFLMTEAAGMGLDDDASVARLFARIAGLNLPGTDKGL